MVAENPTLGDLQTVLHGYTGRLALLQDQKQAKQAQWEKDTKLHQDQEKAQALIQLAAQETQEQIQNHLQDMVQTALDAVFPGVYDFRVVFDLKRGRTEVSMYLEKDGTQMDPMDSTGGGVVDVISTALRIACWTISKTDNVIMMDEPFKFLSAKHRPILGEMLKQLTVRLALQLIIVTHDPDIVGIADRVFLIDQKYRKSYVKEVQG